MERNFFFLLSWVFPMAIVFAKEKNTGPIIDETISGVQLALSAMTALIQSQNDGYRLIKF